MSIKISPIPWQVATWQHIDINGSIESESVQVIDADGYVIMSAANGNIHQSEHDANFMVKACNSYSQLVDALSMIRDADNDCEKDGLPRIPATARAKIDAALAAAA